VTVKRHDDSIKDGCGIDGTEGQTYSRDHAVDPWSSNPRGNFKSPRGAGKYQDDNADFLTNKPPAETGATSYGILDEVEAQSSDSGSRKIRSRGQP
jgi:hypothetical protein